MTVYHETRSLSFPAELMFDLVADVESYPEFLPYWQQARIISRDKDVYFTEQSIGLGPLSDRFQTKTILEPPTRILVRPHRAGRVFSEFHIEWLFESLSEESCEIHLSLNVVPRSPIFRLLANSIMRETAHGMLVAFERRARTKARVS